MLNHEFTTNANILKENHFYQHFKILVWKEVTLIEVSGEIITQHGVIFKSRINHCFAITFASNFYKNKGQPGFSSSPLDLVLNLLQVCVLFCVLLIVFILLRMVTGHVFWMFV